MSSSKRGFVADSLATAMLVMLVITVIQRSIGFVRGIWFCRLMDDAPLGQWSMAYDFVALVTPMVLLGLPGSLPRYVEHYRMRGHLPELVRRLLIATAVLGALFCFLLVALPQWFAWLIFSDSSEIRLVYSLGFSVAATVALGFVMQLVSALRQVRVVSMIQCIQSVLFAVLGVIWLSDSGGVAGLIAAYACATLIAMIPGLITLCSGWRGLPSAEETFDAASMWRRLLPYAVALWAMNVLINVFSLSDRYMILHLLPGGELDAQAAIGQYHSGRILPALFISLATMVAGVIMPYLTADWEAGRPERVRQRLQQILFAVASTFTLGGAISLFVAPWLFNELLQGRYGEGLELMPIAFVMAIWFSLAVLGQEYLWVVERGKLVTVAVAVALLVNVALNFVLLPLWGLRGAVLGTMLANGVMLMGMWAGMSRHGYPIDASTLFISLLPATLLAGPGIAIAMVGLTAIASQTVQQWIGDGLTHWRVRRHTDWAPARASTFDSAPTAKGS